MFPLGERVIPPFLPPSLGLPPSLPPSLTSMLTQNLPDGSMSLHNFFLLQNGSSDLPEGPTRLSFHYRKAPLQSVTAFIHCACEQLRGVVSLTSGTSSNSGPQSCQAAWPPSHHHIVAHDQADEKWITMSDSEYYFM